MLYSLNGPGPLWGLPSLIVRASELHEMDGLHRVDGAAVKVGMTPGKRVVAIEMDGKFDLIMKLRALKTRGFTIYEVTDGGDIPLDPVDGVIVMNGGENWLQFRADAFVLEWDKDVKEPGFIRELEVMPKYLLCDYVSREVMQFLAESKYLWRAQVELAAEVIL